MSDFPFSAHRNLLVFSHAASSPIRAEKMDEASLGSDLVFVLAALICALISGLGLTLLLRCALHCTSRRMVLHSSDEVINSRLKKKAMKALPIIVYTAASKPPGVATDCPICLGEFMEGEEMRVLPRCSHGFHLECIDKWFVSNSSCPLCRHSLNLHNKKKGGGAVIAEATESNDGMHIVIETTDSTQAIGVVPLHTETLGRTPPEAAQL